jgi:hypothetical protein
MTDRASAGGCANLRSSAPCLICYAVSDAREGVIHELTLGPRSMKMVPVIHARLRSKPLRSWFDMLTTLSKIEGRPMGPVLEEDGEHT